MFTNWEPLHISLFLRCCCVVTFWVPDEYSTAQYYFDIFTNPFWGRFISNNLDSFLGKLGLESIHSSTQIWANKYKVSCINDKLDCYFKTTLKGNAGLQYEIEECRKSGRRSNTRKRKRRRRSCPRTNYCVAISHLSGYPMLT